MNLFQECVEVLKDDIEIMDNTDNVLGILNRYFNQSNNVDWSKLQYKDYDDVNLLLSDVTLDEFMEVFVVSDDDEIPVFKSNLKLIVNNIYDVMALSPKLFIFNESIILHPIFPTYTVRVGLLK